MTDQTDTPVEEPVEETPSTPQQTVSAPDASVHDRLANLEADVARVYEHLWGEVKDDVEESVDLFKNPPGE